jgi:hypothetical protein
MLSTIGPISAKMQWVTTASVKMCDSAKPKLTYTYLGNFNKFSKDYNPKCLLKEEKEWVELMRSRDREGTNDRKGCR